MRFVQQEFDFRPVEDILDILDEEIPLVVELPELFFGELERHFPVSPRSRRRAASHRSVETVRRPCTNHRPGNAALRCPAIAGPTLPSGAGHGQEFGLLVPIFARNPLMCRGCEQRESSREDAEVTGDECDEPPCLPRGGGGGGGVGPSLPPWRIVAVAMRKIMRMSSSSSISPDAVMSQGSPEQPVLQLSRKFADRFGPDARAVHDREQGRRVPDRAARILPTVIDRDPEAVIRSPGHPAD